MLRSRRVRTTVAAITLTGILLVGCSSDGESDASSPGGAVDVDAFLVAAADERIVASYESLSLALDDLGTVVDDLCTTPSNASIETVRSEWRSTVVAWQRTRAGGVGPATEQRLKSDVGFEARPGAVTDLLAGEEPVDPASLTEMGATVRGLYAMEIALFGDGADALASDDGARRCDYLAAVTGGSLDATDEVLAAWNDGYRDTFVAGADGDPQLSVSELVNELTFRVQELDTRGLRDFAAAPTLDDLSVTRREGSGAFGIGERQALLGGVAGLIGDVDGDGLAAFVATRSPDTAERLNVATERAVTALDALPDSTADALGSPELDEAADAMAALNVVLSTEVASQLGVTISFSDSDGDS